MHASLYDADELTGVVNSYFRDLQIHGRLDNKLVSKQNQFPKRSVVYKGALHLLDTETVNIDGSLTLDVPCFLVEAAAVIRQNADAEGIFRKNGVNSRMAQIKIRLNKGGKLRDFDQNLIIHDVAGVLLTFLRELPQPLLYGSYQDVLLGCLCKPKLSNDPTMLEEAILIACLPLPRIYLNTLTYFIRLLSYVALKQGGSRMTANNLATCTAQSIMVPPNHLVQDRVNGNIKVIEILIRNADKIGFVPKRMQEKLVPLGGTTLTSASSSEQLDGDTLGPKKRRRSGSLTRALNHGLNNIKRMVGGKTASKVDGVEAANTPCIKSATKRKILQPVAAFSDKHKRQVLKSLPERLALAGNTPGRGGDTELYGLTPRVCNHPNPRKTISPPLKAKQQRLSSKHRLVLPSRKSMKKQKGTDALAPEDASPADVPLTRRWTLFGSKRRTVDVHSVSQHNSENMEEDIVRDNVPESALDLSFIGVDLSQDRSTSSNDFVRIPKSEYESIKMRLLNIEDKISEFDSLSPVAIATDHFTVQTAYEKTLIESTTFDSSSTDQLAKRLSRELKIRQSLENKVIRSPSARRIGSLRRRSRESDRKQRNAAVVRTMSWSERSSLRRGRPNTIMTGLMQPSASVTMQGALAEACRTQLIFPHPILDLKTNGPVTRSQTLASSSFNGSEQYTSPSPAKKQKTVSQANIALDSQEWQDAHKFLFGKKRSPLDVVSSTRRDSVAKILSQNAGLVLQRAKLFDGNCSDIPDTLHRSFDKPKVVDGAKPIIRTQSLFGLGNSSKQPRIQQLRDSPLTKSPARSPVQHAASFTAQKSYLHSLRKSPKKIGSPRKQPERPRAESQYSNKHAAKSMELSTASFVCTPRISSYTDLDQSKENFSKTELSASHVPQTKPVLFSPLVNIPQHLQDTIYSVCTPTNDKVKRKVTISPLKDCNRPLPFIKQPLMSRTPLHIVRTPKAMSERKCTVTPMKALVAADVTPLTSPRRASPRLLLQRERQLKKPL